MCGRFGLTAPQRLAEPGGLLDVLGPTVVDASVPATLAPRWNVAPGQHVLVARTAEAPDGAAMEATVTLDMARWGLVPSWARDARIGWKLVNARAEGVSETPSYRGAWRAGRRCLLPADVFYEWADAGEATADVRNGDPAGTELPDAVADDARRRRPARRTTRAPRQPWAIRLQGGAPFALAGLWERWRDPALPPDAPPLVTCTVLTTTPNALMATLHDRMPVIVPPDAWARWLAPRTSPREAASLLQPYPDAPMEAWPIGLRVNDPRHDDPSVLARA